ncbi:MAG: hypothetical protein HY757_02935 [Nitrospirae bacterium]|nr:hypothetical protein [Nitrospirota bacterium]
MAVETGPFRREDIYSLFITTRIINFLKGLDIPDSITLSELLDQSWSDKRTQIGIELLKELQHSGQLYFQTSGGRILNRKFRTGLFMSVLRNAEHITCQNGKQISVGNFAA